MNEFMAKHPQLVTVRLSDLLKAFDYFKIVNEGDKARMSKVKGETDKESERREK